MMKILATLDDDFPCSAASTVEPRKFYEAFIKAEEILASAPKQYRDTAEERLPELTSFLYRGGDAASALYRKRDSAPEVLTTIWLSNVRRLAGWYIAANNVTTFQGIEKSVLSELPRRFKNPLELPEISPFLANYGIVLVWVNAVPSMKLDGAVFSVPSGHIVISLSLRYTRLDYFWFTLLHELSHVVLHSNQLSTPILDDLDEASGDLVEQQADRLASDSLIPKNEWRSCPARYSNSLVDVISFSSRLGIPPQCVAGRLRRELNRYDIFSDIINEHNVREILNGH